MFSLIKFKNTKPPNLHIGKLYFKNDNEIIALRITSLIVVLSMVLVIADMKIRPIVENVGGSALKNTLTHIVDGAVNEIVDELNIKYSDMVDIKKDEEGTICAITLNSSYINGYKSDISDGCSKKLSNFDETVIPIPIGSILGGSFLNGRGPKIKLKATVYGFTVADVSSKFESAGINQTRHTIYLDVKASAHAYLGLCHLNESVDETIILVETIIVGKVPQTYYVKGNDIDNDFSK